MNLPSRLSVRQKAVAVAGASALVAAGLVTIPASVAQAAPGCSVTYSANQWQGGFSANITIRNVGDAINGWTLRFSFADAGQRVTQGWSANWTQSGTQVTATNVSWNGNLATGASTGIGFNGSFSGSNPAPTSFSINGTTCNGTAPTTPPTGGPTGNPTNPPTTNPTSNPAARVDNPYAGARGYVNPEWKAKAESVSGGNRISNNPTGVWLDRIAAIEGTPDSSSNGSMGLRDHLDEALAQGAGYIQLVIYNLPGRDCAALASNGELKADELPKYKTQYIDPIAAIMGDSKYSSLRIIAIIEIDSLPNLVTNVAPRETATAQCDTMKANGNYVKGVGYALAKLGAVPNVYNYIDAGHHGWIGWDDNFRASAQIFAEAARAEGSTQANVHGFIANTANYSATVEPYLNVTEQNRLSKWIDYNRYVDEQRFAQALRTELVSQGFSSSIGMLIDTSRNGWGGSARPTGPRTSGTVDEQVDGSRIDRRIHLGNWCNQSGAGIGERPRSAPASGIDAYVWIKPPGESDGSSTQIDNDEGKGFDRMCDPTYTGNPRNNNNMSGALSGAPISGAWFPAQLTQLMQNAYPAL
ncbi:glycoside hydrolase family 6 protein [Plantactinospora sp. BB1]|uniref:glycoside hydrolase family 6 protein n=1 Tax=Plantactinospora sp. BB1 TaxID=2071627 RepID=UPI000D16D8CC|nr:glycoside hydrolase family 6 protein [Plantactinospora sp. BB1]AVT41727.1 cellulose 1,4-beta-cellobiosidase [Plantactinospora sp. BB1]